MISRYDIKVSRFDKKSFLNTILGFSPYWEYKSFRGYDKDDYSEKKRKLSLTNKIHLKCGCIDCSVLNSIKQPILYSFLLDKPSGYKVFSHPETVHCKKN